MKIVNTSDVEEKEIEGMPLFTGGKVYSQFALDEEYNTRRYKLPISGLHREPATGSIPTRSGKSW